MTEPIAVVISALISGLFSVAVVLLSRSRGRSQRGEHFAIGNLKVPSSQLPPPPDSVPRGKGILPAAVVLPVAAPVGSWVAAAGGLVLGLGLAFYSLALAGNADLLTAVTNLVLLGFIFGLPGGTIVWMGVYSHREQVRLGRENSNLLFELRRELAGGITPGGPTPLPGQGEAAEWQRCGSGSPPRQPNEQASCEETKPCR